MKYGLHFLHDVETNFENEYKDIVSKYERRIHNFKTISISGVIYIRAIRNVEEVNFIRKNYQYIHNVITKYSANNEIIFLLPKELSTDAKIEFNYYILNSIYDGTSHEALRGLFRKNDDIIDYFDQIIDPAVKKENLLFDLKQENTRLGTIADKFFILDKLINADLSAQNLPPKIAIYGLGVIGKYLYHLVKDLTEVVCFIDSHTKTKTYDGVKVYSLKEIIDSDITIVITPIQYYSEISSFYLEDMKINPSNLVSIEQLFK